MWEMVGSAAGTEGLIALTSIAICMMTPLSCVPKWNVPRAQLLRICNREQFYLPQ